MHLKITDETKQQLEQIRTPEKPILRLHYDTDGCGCGVDGFPTFFFTDEVREGTDKLVVTDDYKVIIDREQAIFFKQDMKLAFVKGSFRLSSPDGILNPIISIKDVKGRGVER